MDDLVKQARLALDGVTDGPWYFDRAFYYVYSTTTEGDAVCQIHRCEADGTFIAAARELVPAMADRIEALTSDLAAARAALDEAVVRMKAIQIASTCSGSRETARAFIARHTRIYATEYAPATARETCDQCGQDRELRALPGPDPQEWLCRTCCKDAAPELDFDKLDIVQEERG